jgi:hypothetical protein
MSGDGRPEVSALIVGWFNVFGVVEHIFVGAACMLISSVLIFNRAAATRAMFDNRVAFGAFVTLSGFTHFGAVAAFGSPARGLEALILPASCVVSLIVAWVTIGTLVVKRAAPP